MRIKKVVVAFGLIAALVCGMVGCNSANNENSETPEKIVTENQTGDVITNIPGPESSEDTIPEDAAVQGPTADEIVADIVIGWNLGNALDSNMNGRRGLSTETCWGNPKTTKEMIDKIKATGFNAVRVPVTWFNHLDLTTNEIETEWMDRVEEVVNYVLDNDMYCIINVHHDTGEKGWLRASSKNIDAKMTRYKAIWKQVSERFKDYDDKLLFESFNEILDENNEWTKPGTEAVTVTNELNQLFVDTVRASGGKNATRCLVLNTYCAGGNKEVTQGFVMPNDTVDNKLIVEAHIYQPFYFTSHVSPDVIEWANNKYTLESQLKNMYNSFVKQGIPVIIGEFGAVDKNNNTRQRETWLRFYIDTCYNYGIKCFWWDNGNVAEYEIMDRLSLEITEPTLVEIMMTEANGGTYVFEPLPEEPVNVVGENMCAGISNWSYYINGDNGAAGTGKIQASGAYLSVEKPGGNTWDAQLSYSGLTLEQGVTYHISFDYTGSPAQYMQLHIMQRYEPYGLYSSIDLDYKEETQRYEGTFTMTQPTDKNAGLTFDCGASDCGVPYMVKIENLVMQKVEEETADGTAQ